MSQNLAPFGYVDPGVACLCERKATEIRAYVSKSVENIVAIGTLLEDVYTLLNRSRPVFLAWVSHHFGWSEDTSNNYRAAARAVEHYPELINVTTLRLLYQFESLDLELREKLLEKGVRSWDQAYPLIWDHDMRQYLDQGTGTRPSRYGDVKVWIQQALTDPRLEQVARELYEENRDHFVHLDGRSGPEVDAEVLTEDPPPQDHHPEVLYNEPDTPQRPPGSMMVYGRDDVWLYQFDDRTGKAIPWSMVEAFIPSTNGGPPIVVFPKATDARDRSLQLSVMDAAARSCGTKSPRTRYREVRE